MLHLSLHSNLKSRIACIVAAIVLAFTTSLAIASPASASVLQLDIDGNACYGGGIAYSSNHGSVMYYTPWESGYALYADYGNFFQFKLKQYHTEGTDLDLVIKCDNGVWYYLDTIHVSGLYSGVRHLGWV